MAADPLDQLARSYLLSRGNCSPRAPTVRVAEQWVGVPVAFARQADGTVAATYLGLTGIGPTAADALVALDRLVRAGEVVHTLRTGSR